MTVVQLPPTSGGWPQPPAAAAFYGLAGRVVETIAPFSEADPVAILADLLVAFGCAVGTGPHAMVGATRHSARTFAVLVGRTSKARKDDGWRAIADLVGRTCPALRQREGLSTGEGLIHAVRDPEKDDEGVTDKRLLIHESEGARTLRVMRRDTNTLSQVIRTAWDGRELSVMTRNAPATATGAHIAIVANITLDELRREMTSGEGENGFANRFLWLLVRRSKLLPEPPAFAGPVVNDLVLRLAESLAAAEKIGQIRRDPAATTQWAEIYPDLSAERDGLAGAVLARAEAQVLRLSLIYALLDGSPVVRPVHLDAALALWAYVEESVIRIFGDATGDAIADAILGALRATGPMTRTQIRDLFGRNVQVDRIAAALQMLAAQGLATSTTGKPGERGRPAETWTAVAQGRDIRSSRSFRSYPQRDGENGEKKNDINDRNLSRVSTRSFSGYDINDLNDLNPEGDYLVVLAQQGPPEDPDEDAG